MTDLIQHMRDEAFLVLSPKHSGTIDVVDIDVAIAALEQQAAQIEALQLTKAGLIDSLREEMDEGLRLRELGGALPNENITAMTERLIGERAALAAELSALRADAERFRYSITVNRNGRMNWRDVYDDWNGEGEFADAIDAAMKVKP